MKKVKYFINLLVVITLVAFTVFSPIKVDNCKAYSVNLSKSEYQLHRFWYFPGDDGSYLRIPLYLQCTTHNTLRATGNFFDSRFTFYYDDWYAIVTDGSLFVDNTFPSYATQFTEYFDSHGNSIHNSYERTTYQVLQSPNWIVLCSSYANISVTAPAGGHITGSVLGRFDDPPVNPISSQLFLATTTITF